MREVTATPNYGCTYVCGDEQGGGTDRRRGRGVFWCMVGVCSYVHVRTGNTGGQVGHLTKMYCTVPLAIRPPNIRPGSVLPGQLDDVT